MVPLEAMPVEHVTIHGREVAFRRAGSGPVVVLVHGIAGSSSTWKRAMPRLAERFTVIAPDLMGHGASAKPATEYSLGAHANFLRDLLDVLGHERATFVGQSLGGGIVMQLAYQFPERCERLVLVSSGGLGREVTPLLRLLSLPGAEWIVPIACRPGVLGAGERFAAWVRRLGFEPSASTTEMWRGFAALGSAESRRAFFRTLRAVVDFGGQSVSAQDRLYLASELPVLIVWGDRDPFIPVDHGVAAHEALPGSRLVVFEGVGHFPHCEAPERFVAALVDFIRTTDAARVEPGRLREVLRAAVGK
jgi:pimeloyl-ACP methyl ester carboxylesterase